MTAGVYRLKLTQGFSGHFPGAIGYVRDGEDDGSELAMVARVRSGDYFMTLATELDKCAQSLAREQGDEAAELERLVSELLLVHKQFEIVRKKS
ncbi:MAG TPA: hypothetical protein VK983_00635 [Candidatus Limnocylindrales bacterium]|nr:hypothetical protein [Candidatus Limnocylindrales bacterium]